MNFTKQQESGGARYNTACRLGNWSEDLVIEQDRLKDFLNKKEKGELQIDKSRTKRKICNKLCDVSYATDECYIQYGSYFMIAHDLCQGFLCVDPYDKIIKDETTFAVTVGKNPEPIARNVFLLEKAEETPDNILRFGQKIRIRINPEILENGEMYLFSEIVTPMNFSKYSRHQQVVFHPIKNSGTIWTIAHADCNLRIENEGHPVRVDSAIVIRHSQTAAFLASDVIKYPNDHGLENEVCVHSFTKAALPQMCENEKKGIVDWADLERRQPGPQNLWRLVVRLPSNN
eukprot:GHVL01035530.1.p1 GENE.GHVL01035530.1~~GHVL01035530.1.p1  ORF type:complete len:288 (-),score=58.13 GHVL01035530.1:396-1259(-)